MEFIFGIVNGVKNMWFNKVIDFMGEFKIFIFLSEYIFIGILLVYCLYDYSIF